MMPPSGPSSSSRLNRIPLPATWDNIYPVYLRRSEVFNIASTWTSLGGAERFPEIQAGIKGAYVRVLIPKIGDGADSKIRQGYHVMQVEDTVVEVTPNGEEVRLKLEGLKIPVAIQKLSDKWPDKEELVALQKCINVKQAMPLLEASLRETVTRLATMCHFKLLQNALEQQPVTAEAVSTTYAVLQEYVDEDRRRILSSGTSTNTVFATHPSPGGLEVYKGNERKDDPARRRSERIPGSKSAFGEGLDYADSDDDVGGTRRTPIGKRRPVIANMKARRYLSLNLLMKTAKSAVLDSQSEESESESE